MNIAIIYNFRGPMGVNKLDLEFEDDDEIEARAQADRQKNEVEDIDLKFGMDASVSAVRNPLLKSQGSGENAQKKSANAREGSSVNQLKQPKQSHSNPERTMSPPNGRGLVYLGEEYKLGDELKKVSVNNQVLAIEIEARIQIEVAQRITGIVAQNTTNAKFLEHKINKILSQLNQKSPASKKELIMIKKELAKHVHESANPSKEEKSYAVKKENPKKKAA